MAEMICKIVTLGGRVSYGRGVFDFRPTPPVEIEPYERRYDNDAEAIRADWINVGQDIYRAIGQYGQLAGAVA